MGKGFGMVALILGTISIPICFFTTVLASISSFESDWPFPPVIELLLSLLSLLIPIMAIILGIIGIMKDYPRGMAIAGCILGLIGIVVVTFLRIMYAAIYATLIP